MHRHTSTFSLTGNLQETKTKMLHWVNQFSIFLFLDSNDYRQQHGKYNCLLAANPYAIISSENETDALQQAAQWHSENADWLFGHICYDFKNQLHPKLSSRHPANHNFPELQFFAPNILISISENGTELTISCTGGYAPENIFQEINDTVVIENWKAPALHFDVRLAKEEYIAIIQKLQKHICDGDCYEINFCNHGFAQSTEVNPLEVFKKLNAISPAPFAAFYRLQNQFALCASPERFLQKTGNKIIAQPIKGTAPRKHNPTADAASRKALQESEKDRAEHVMIVDLMRNDLALSCAPGSVKVDELYGLYAFPQVHQMISTISGTLQKEKSFADVLANAFPMGSMTGAPKMKVMELIEQYEMARRGLFSGTVGYITPSGDFDFNVVIRSLFYNADTGYLSYGAGGAITYDSIPEMEWEEMKLKAAALEKLFQYKP